MISVKLFVPYRIMFGLYIYIWMFVIVSCMILFRKDAFFQFVPSKEYYPITVFTNFFRSQDAESTKYSVLNIEYLMVR